MSEPNLKTLKSRAQLLKPSVRLGKEGVTPAFLAAFEEAFHSTDLVKLRFENFKEERKSLSKDIAEKSGTRLVQQVGHTAVYFKPRPSGPV